MSKEDVNATLYNTLESYIKVQEKKQEKQTKDFAGICQVFAGWEYIVFPQLHELCL